MWLDSYLLRLASSFAKKFNWLTGKDNFWLSYQLFIISVINLVIAYYYAQLNNKGPMLAGILLTLAISPLIKIMEETKSEHREVKIFELEIYFLFIRLVLLLSMVLLFVRYVLVEMATINDEVFIFRCIWVICSTLAFYLASVDRPPFSKSHAREWLKNTFSFFPLKPIPVTNR